jgi:hypothetical protein
MAEKVEFKEGADSFEDVKELLASWQGAHVEYSAMADNKASILMGATFVVFSLTLGEMETNKISLPLLLLGGFSFAATVLSVMTIIPVIGGRKSNVGTPNLLFFGVFSRMKEEEFIDAFASQLTSRDAIYRLIARDVYQNGVVLQRHKYRYLTYAYRTFLVGLVVTAAGFVGQSIFG